jgi:hypothetical protein
MKTTEWAFNQFGAKWQITSPYCLSRTCSCHHSTCLFFAKKNAGRVICILQFLLRQVSTSIQEMFWQKILYGRVSRKKVTYLGPRTKETLVCGNDSTHKMADDPRWLFVNETENISAFYIQPTRVVWQCHLISGSNISLYSFHLTLDILLQ